MAETKLNHLEELKSSHYYEIADDQPDITNWNIMDETGKKLGEVKDLLFDKEDEKVRYIVTNLKDGIMEENRRVLIPIGKASLNKDDKRVVVPQVTRGKLTGLPEYSKTEDMTAEDERAIRRIFSSEHTTEDTGTYDKRAFYEHEDFDEDKFYEGEGAKSTTAETSTGARRDRKSTSRIQRRVVDRPVEEQVEENFEAKRTNTEGPTGEEGYTLKKGETSEGGGAKKEARVVEKVSGKNVRKNENVGTEGSSDQQRENRRTRKNTEENPNRNIDVENARNDRKDINNKNG